MKSNVKWWCIVAVDREISRYYRGWIQKTYHIKGLVKPAWDAHISVVRGEIPANINKILVG